MVRTVEHQAPVAEPGEHWARLLATGMARNGDGTKPELNGSTASGRMAGSSSRARPEGSTWPRSWPSTYRTRPGRRQERRRGKRRLVCPNFPDHGDSAYVGRCAKDGAIAAGCSHNSCDWTWAELRAHFEDQDQEEDPAGLFISGEDFLRLAMVTSPPIWAVGRWTCICGSAASR
jgi:hypothetical protein